MSWVSDVLGFELFNGKHILKKLKKDPERLLLGIDPASTGLWNKILGRDDEPLVDQMGGAYDGKVLSLGNDGGIYKKAEKHGIDTGPGLDMQRAAHVIAAMFAANGLMGIGGGSPSPSPTSPTPDPGSGGMFDFSSMDWQDPNTYIKLSKMMPQQQPQQAPQQVYRPPQQVAQQPAPNDLSWETYLQDFYKFRQMADYTLDNSSYYA